MNRDRVALILSSLLVLLGAGAVAGCGGSTSSASGGGGGSLSLVAYSTPQEVYAKLISGFDATSAGSGAGAAAAGRGNRDDQDEEGGEDQNDTVSIHRGGNIDKLHRVSPIRTVTRVPARATACALAW